MLSSHQIACYGEKGYLGVENVFSKEEIGELRRVTDEFVEKSREVSKSGDIFNIEPTHRREHPQPRRLLLFQYCAIDAWPLMSGEKYRDTYLASIFRGEPINQPRLAPVPARLPRPEALNAGGIYEIQEKLKNPTYKKAG